MDKVFRVIKDIFLRIRFMISKRFRIDKKCTVQGTGFVSVVCKEKVTICL